MNEKPFSKGEAIRFGWGVTTANLGFFVGVLAIAGVITAVPNVLQKFTAESAPVQSALFGIAGVVFQVIVGIGLITISLKFVDNARPAVGDLFARLDLFFRYLGGYVLYSLIVVAGLILLIVPGIMWGLKFCLWGYLVIDRELGPIKALEKSSNITNGAKWELFLFGLLLLGINLLGAVALLIGLFVTIPTSFVATAYVYRKLLARAEVTQAISR